MWKAVESQIALQTACPDVEFKESFFYVEFWAVSFHSKFVQG